MHFQNALLSMQTVCNNLSQGIDNMSFVLDISAFINCVQTRVQPSYDHSFIDVELTSSDNKAVVDMFETLFDIEGSRNICAGDDGTVIHGG